MAYWIKHHSGGVYCSNCNRWFPHGDTVKRCEHCGAEINEPSVEDYDCKEKNNEIYS